MLCSLRPYQRIRKKKSFDCIIKKGKFVKGRVIHLWVCPTRLHDEEAQERVPMFGVIVSKKTDLRANRRNTWKRRLREVFRHHQKEIGQALSVLVQSRRVKEIPSYQTLEEELLQLLEKAKALKK